MSFYTIQKKYLLISIVVYFAISITTTLQDPLIDVQIGDSKKNKTEYDPLILTPFIINGTIEEAKKLAKVHLKDLEDIESYSGFLTVNETCSTNMFFWFFPSERKNMSDPIILWLQGGPGLLSMHGMVEKVGPLYIENGTRFKKQEYHWGDKRNLLFIDNPVGTGFSFTKDIPECYSHNSDDIRQNLYKALIQFYELFPTLQNNELFLFGESYAGKYVPALAYTIHENNNKSLVKMNLKGLGIGNGFVDPISTLHYSSLLYNLGLINTNGRNELEILEKETIRLIKMEKWLDALKVYNFMSLRVTNLTFNTDICNYLKLKTSIGNYTYFLDEDVKHAIHTNSVQFRRMGLIIFSYLFEDYFKSAKPWVEELLEHYRVVFYNGQLDLLVGAVLTQNLIESLNWSGARKFRKEQQFAVSIEDVLIFGTHYGNLYEYRIRNAAHSAVKDQPKAIYYIMESFLNNTDLK